MLFHAATSGLPLVFPQIDLMPHDVITQLLRVLAIETKQEKAIINADPTDAALSGLEAFSFDYIVKWPLSLIINRFCPAAATSRFHLIYRFTYFSMHLVLDSVSGPSKSWVLSWSRYTLVLV